MSAPIEELKVEDVAAYATGSYKPQPVVKNFGGARLTNVAGDRTCPTGSGRAGKKLHISEQPFTLQNWYLKINWLNVILVLAIPISGLVTAVFTPLKWQTAVWAVIYYVMTGLSITAGYHRLFAHRAYGAAWPLRLFYALVGGGAVEGSVRWWAASHRVHHRYTDTDKDPYNAKNGFFYSHLGWMLVVPNPKHKGRCDISDLNADPIVRWQHRQYIFVLFFMAYIFPAMVGALWGDAFGGFIYAGILRVGFVQQATFCVNSLAHWIGEQPFDDRRTPRDHVLTALVTLGEGYHNFHHEFPSDYRNAIRWYQFDPTKIVIWITKQLGLAYDLKKFSQNAIEQGLVQQQQKKLDRWRSKLNWGIPIDQLPIIEFDDFKAQSTDRALVLISGIVHDVTDFINEHPGGLALIKSSIGKDGTAVFNGGVYAHSNAAHNLLATMRCAVIRGGCEVEVWRQQQRENKDVGLKSDSEGKKIVRAGEQATISKKPVATADAA